MHKKVDLRGLTPPEPVVRTKRLLTEMDEGIVEVLVDVGPSKDDILHFANFKKYQAEVVAQTATAVRLKIVKGNPPPAAERLLLITSGGLGEDNRRLASGLMANMLHAIAESRERPAKIVLVNSGVTLACEGSPALGTFRRLSDSGAVILVSAESLDYLGLRARLAAGTAADIAQLTEAVLSAGQVLRL